MYEIFSHSIMKERRRELRKNPTPQESKLWGFLRTKNLGQKFRRQHSIGPYIVDFYCWKKNLVIELDGAVHKETKEYDQERNEYMKTLGMKVLRFWNDEVDKNIEGVLMKIKEEL